MIKKSALFLALLITYSITSGQERKVYPTSTFSVPSAGLVNTSGSHPFEFQLKQLSRPGIEQTSDSHFVEVPPLSDYRYINTAGRTKRAAITPRALVDFKANNYNGFTPPDNTIAVSNGGVVVSAMNTNMYYYDTQGLQLGFTTFVKLVRTAFPSLRGKLYDPRLLYDQETDRFVIVLLHGSESSESQILAFFSKSNNPLEGWYAYSLTGDIDNQGYWMDYPNIGLNNHSLFISGNMFDDNGNFRETKLLKVSKAEGYAGSELDISSWADLRDAQGAAFTLVPAQSALRGTYSEDMYFACSEGQGGNFITVFTYTHSDGGLEAKAVSVTSYDGGNNAPQRNTDQVLSPGDTRVQDVLLMNGELHVVHGTRTTSGHSALAYHRIDIQDRTAQTKVMHNAGQGNHLTFPTIAAIGEEWDDNSVILCFTESGPNIFPRLMAMHVDQEFELSDVILLQEGASYVDILDEDEERWGDYIHVCRQFNSNSCWVFGNVGSEFNTFDNHVFRLSLDNTAGISSRETEEQPNLVFPNPLGDFATVTFELEQPESVQIGLYDLKGNLIEWVFRDHLKAGKKSFRIRTTDLSAGTYQLIVQTRDGSIAELVVKL